MRMYYTLADYPHATVEIECAKCDRMTFDFGQTYYRPRLLKTRLSASPSLGAALTCPPQAGFFSRAGCIPCGSRGPG